jgi:hypothetical protein
MNDMVMATVIVYTYIVIEAIYVLELSIIME